MFQKILVFGLLSIMLLSMLGGNSIAVSTVEVRIFPNATTITVGSGKIVVTALVNQRDVKFKWELIGPGELETLEGSTTAYIIPDSIEGNVVQATITVTVTDKTNQETRQSIILELVANSETDVTSRLGLTATPTPVPHTTSNRKSSQSIRKRVLLGVGAATLVGGVASLASGGGDNEEVLNVTGTWRFIGQLTRNDCNLTTGSGFDGTFPFTQTGSTVTTPRMYLTIGGSRMDFIYRGTVTKKNVSLAAVDPHVSGNFHFGSGIEIQNINDNTGTGSLNLTGAIVGMNASCQTVWSGTWTKQ